MRSASSSSSSSSSASASASALVFVLVAAASALACDTTAPAGPADAAPHEDRGGSCATCHMPEFRQVKEPPHVDVKPTTCGVCHSQEGWRPSVQHHDWWPLTGAHVKADCLYCHQGKPPSFVGTPKECAKCHMPEFDSSTYPEHSTFGTKCADCHTTTTFKPATKIPPPTPPPTPAPAPTVAPLSTKGANGKPIKAGPGGRPLAPVAPAPPPPQRPTTPPAPRPPDVISRPSSRRH